MRFLVAVVILAAASASVFTGAAAGQLPSGDSAEGSGSTCVDDFFDLCLQFDFTAASDARGGSPAEGEVSWVVLGGTPLSQTGVSVA